MRLVLIFHRFGPYHMARFTGCVESIEDVIGVELSGADVTYAWDKRDSGEGLPIKTLFPNRDSDELPYNDVEARVWRCLDDLQPDVVAVPGWSKSGALAALFWCITNQVPAVLMSESTCLDHPRHLIKEAVKRPIVSLFSSALVGGDAHVKYLQALGMSEKVISFGYNIVDNQYFSNGAKAARDDVDQLRIQMELPERYFLSCARFIEEKNLSKLLDAYTLYMQQCKSKAWSMVLVGDGELRGRLEAQANKLECAKNIYFPGFKQIDELPIYYGLARAFVLPSEVEPWGLVVNEAMASGLPVLVSDHCGSAELVLNGENGWTFAPDSIEAMADSMKRVAELTSEGYDAFCGCSKQRIADWGPEKFGKGLKLAAETAIRVGPKKKRLISALAMRLAMIRS